MNPRRNVLAQTRPKLARLRGVAPEAATRAATASLIALPGALTLYTAFNAGGFFAGSQAGLAVLLAAVLALRVTVAREPFAGATLSLAVAAGALSLLGGWALLSASWSQAPARALVEFDRVLLYVLVLLLFGLLAMTVKRLAWMVRVLMLATLVICAAGLISRLLPEVWPIASNIVPSRLSYPVTYWNTLGLVGALGLVLGLHLTCSEREPWWVRVPAAAGVPLLACTVYFTLSRGGIGVGVLGMVAYLLLGRPRAVVGGLLAVGPASAVAVAACYRAPALVSLDPTGPAAVAQGRSAALVVGLCALGAAAVRLPLLWPDRWLAARRPRRVYVVAAITVAVAGVAGTAAKLDAPGLVAAQYRLFVEPRRDFGRADPRQRIFDPTNNGRLDHWDAALKGYRAARWTGQGAGTYQIIWNQHRPYPSQVFDAHSLYVELLGELGIPGLAFAALALLTIMAGAARRIRGPDRALFAAIVAAMLAWAVRAAADWDWEMPVVTLWLFAVGGATLATPVTEAQTRRARAVGRALHPGPTLRLLIAIGCLVLAVAPARMVVSQGQLNRSVRAFERGDCAEAVDASLDSISAIGLRPEPFQILGWCDVRLGRADLAVRAMNQAVSRDPRNWEYHYGLALVRGAARMDPRPAAREAARLNPHEPLAARAVRRFRTGNPRLWRARALRSRLPQG